MSHYSGASGKSSKHNSGPSSYKACASGREGGSSSNSDSHGHYGASGDRYEQRGTFKPRDYHPAFHPGPPPSSSSSRKGVQYVTHRDELLTRDPLTGRLQLERYSRENPETGKWEQVKPKTAKDEKKEKLSRVLMFLAS